MKYLSILLAALFFSSNTIYAQQTINGTLMHDNIQREYILYVPASYDPNTPTPLVLSFHGYTSTAAINFEYTNFTAIADTAGFILIHPQGTLYLGSTHWNVGGFTLGSTVDDVGFTNALLDTISQAYTIDQNRMYSTGMSNGGFMSFLLACQLSDKIAAVASVTGSMTPETFNPCNPLHPTPVLQIHGDNDAVVPYDGGVNWSESIEDVLQYWIAFNNCNSAPTTINIPNTIEWDNSTVDHFIYGDGNNGVTTEHFKVYGGGHDWPGAWGNMDIDASIEVWNFFRRYDINGLIDSEPVGIDENIFGNDAILFFPNPVRNTFTIENELAVKMNFRIYSAIGSLEIKGTIGPNQNTIDLSHLSSGMYLLKLGGQTLKLIKAE